MQTLEGFYASLADNAGGSHFTEIGRRLLELLSYLPLIDGAPVWAVTSHEVLRLVATDDFGQPSLVAISGGGYGEAFRFVIDYPMPAGEVPWPGVQVRLFTHDAAAVRWEMVAYGLGKATGVAYSFRRPAGTGSS